MSARGRNTAARAQDALGAYDTPRGVCAAWWNDVQHIGEFQNVRQVLEGHVGTGNWLRTMPLELRAGKEIEIMDLDPMAPALEEADVHGWSVTACAPAQSIARAGFLVTDPKRRPDLVIGNPPYSVIPPLVICPMCQGHGFVPGSRLCPKCKREDGMFQPPAIFVATHHVVRALRLTKRHVVFLLRVGFVGSSKRLPLFRRIRPRHEWRLFPRPRFRHGGSDSSEYSVFWWDLDNARRTRDLRSWTTSVLEWKDTDPCP